MKKLHTTAALLAAAAFAAVLLTGCGNTASSSSAASSAAPSSSTATSEAGSEAASSSSMAASSGSGAASGAAMSEPAAGGYSAAGLNAVLDGCVAFEAGTAGGSLKTAKAADALVRYLAANPAATLGEDAKAWSDGLDEDKKGALTMNWDGIYSSASEIAADPESQKDILTDAGVDADYTGVDMSGVQAQLDALNAAFGNA